VPGAGTELIFAGASIPGRGTPWGSLAEIAKAALEPDGYKIEIETRSFMYNNARFVADGRAAVGFTNLTQLVHAYRGMDAFTDDGPHDALRLVALINHATWLGVAARHGSGIGDLRDVLDKSIPARIRAGGGGPVTMLAAHYGWTPERLSAIGAAMLPTHERDPGAAEEPAIVEPHRERWAVEGDFDLIIDTIYGGYTPEIHHWAEASILYDLDFLPVESELVDAVTSVFHGRAGSLPHRLVRGLWHDVSAIARLPQAIYVRDDLSDDVVTDLTAALDANHEAFRRSHLAFSYDPANVTAGLGVPLHRAAAAYYATAGYPVIGG